MACCDSLRSMGADDSLPDDVNTLKAMLRAERAARLAAEAEAQARTLLIEKLKLTIKKLRHEQFGQSSERGALLGQLELQLADLEENAAHAETAAQLAAPETITVPAFERRKPARRPLPAHLPRERIVYPAPSTCPCCGDSRLRKIGEDVTETLELIPRQWKVIQHVREKFSCRACEAITQPTAPSHPIARGRAGPKLLAHVLFAKYGLHLPLNRQSDVYEREGIDLEVSTLADWGGAAAATLMPLVDVIRAHVFAAERIHADDTTVPVLAKGKTRVSDTIKAINYSLNRWDAFTRFLDDGRLCMSNNAAERELRAVALTTSPGSDEDGRRAAAIYTLIATAKLNDVDPQTWLADVLARLPDHSAKRIHELLPWNWRRQNVLPMAEACSFRPKPIRPVALTGWVPYDQLHHFIAAGVWDAKPSETELLVQADKLVGASDGLSQLCPLCATPSSNSARTTQQCRIAESRSATSGGVNKISQSSARAIAVVPA